MDAFYASVELLRYPELRGKAVVIGGGRRHQPFALAQMRADLSGLRQQVAIHLLDLVEQRRQRLLVDCRIAAQRAEHLLLPLELLEQIGLQVRARRDVSDLEQ